MRRTKYMYQLNIETCYSNKNHEKWVIIMYEPIQFDSHSVCFVCPRLACLSSNTHSEITYPTEPV